MMSIVPKRRPTNRKQYAYKAGIQILYTLLDRQTIGSRGQGSRSRGCFGTCLSSGEVLRGRKVLIRDEVIKEAEDVTIEVCDLCSTA